MIYFLKFQLYLSSFYSAKLYVSFKAEPENTAWLEFCKGKICADINSFRYEIAPGRKISPYHLQFFIFLIWNSAFVYERLNRYFLITVFLSDTVIYVGKQMNKM